MKFKLLFALLFFASLNAQARVFDMTKETFAPYFALSAGPSAIGKAGFENEAGTNVTYSQDVKYNYSGEFGFVYAQPKVNFKFGFEILKPQLLDNVNGVSGGSTLYSETSDILGYAPKFSLEVNFKKTNTYRAFASGTVGYANVTLKNTYSLTAAGQTAYPGVTDHTAESKGYAPMYGASVGIEGIMTDTTTYVFELGYRYLKIDNLSYSKDVTTFDGAKTSGSSVLDNGSQRVLDLSGAVVSIGFRFYL